jgi:autotransporter strand-loop-strand O-heptosyltransferase
MKKIKLLYLAPHLSTGGCPQFILKRIQTLLDYTDSFEIFVIEYADYGRSFPVQRDQIIKLLGNNFYSIGEDKMKIISIIDRIKPDIIHLDEMPELMGNDELFKKIYSNNRTWRIVETCHNSSFRPDDSKRFYPDMYSFCTPWHENIFTGMDAQFVTIPYPIDKVEITPKNRLSAKLILEFDFTKIHVINVGLWTSGKNQAEGIEIARKYPDIMFHFIGNQAANFMSYWEPLMNNLPENVKVWGERTDISTFMLAADIFMFNSTLELNPLVLREAISYDLPIIARNLPQYAGMYDDYINPIDTDLKNVHFRANHKIPTDCTSVTFALRHEEAYKKILELPIHKQSVRIINHYVDNPYLEILGTSDSDYRVEFYDKWDLVYSNTMKSNHWIKVNRQYFTNWTVKVFDGDEMVYADFLHLHSKRVYIAFESKSLGDTIAWIPYVEEFRKKHQCNVVCSTFWNRLFDYPEIEFVEPGTIVDNLYALYRIGYFDHPDKLPVKPMTLSLQNVAAAILGLDHVEIVPKLAYTPKVPTTDVYVTIATNSTSGCKFWTKEGWQALINWLSHQGYKVYNVSAEPNPFDNCTQITTPSLESKMDWIEHSEFFIGLSSGLSWVAWALGKPVVMISNFTEDWSEFKCHRITKKNVCHGCWNNPNFSFDPGDYNWCPIHKGTNRQFECHNSITAGMVIDYIEREIIWKRY